MYSDIDKAAEEERIRQTLKDKFHEDFISNSFNWKVKMRTINNMLMGFSEYESLRISKYRYDSFCRVCYYAVSDVIDQEVSFYSVYPNEIEALALKDSLLAQEKYSKDSYVELLEEKRKEKFLSLQITLSKSMEKKMLRFLVENKAKGKYEEFVSFINQDRDEFI